MNTQESVISNGVQAAQINKYGGSEAVQINEHVTIPKPAKGQLLIEVHAAGVNPADWKIRQGYMQQVMPWTFPATLGGDFSGVVKEVGPLRHPPAGGADGASVSEFKQGDEVYGQADIMHGIGSFAQFTLAESTNVAPKPKSVNHIKAAALPLAGTSALQALIEHMNIKSGQRILIHGGAGGIGSFAIQITKHLGAYVITTTSTDDVEFVKALGADEVIDYKTQSFDELVSGIDAVFDTVGGETYDKSFKVLKKGGILVSMVQPPKEELAKQYGVNAIVQASMVTSERLSKLAQLVEQGVIRVHIDRTFPLEQTARALEYLQTGHPRGKVVITIKEN